MKCNSLLRLSFKDQGPFINILQSFSGSLTPAFLTLRVHLQKHIQSRGLSAQITPVIFYVHVLKVSNTPTIQHLYILQ